MPGGLEAWSHLEPIWKAIAAKVDPKTGKPLEGAKPGEPVVVASVDCYIGPTVPVTTSRWFITALNMATCK